MADVEVEEVDGELWRALLRVEKSRGPGVGLSVGVGVELPAGDVFRRVLRQYPLQYLQVPVDSG
jgi:hypothetical protein